MCLLDSGQLVGTSEEGHSRSLPNPPPTLFNQTPPRGRGGNARICAGGRHLCKHCISRNLYRACIMTPRRREFYEYLMTPGREPDLDRYRAKPSG